jgi:hypothetical protein
MLAREEDYQRAASFVRLPELCGNPAIETIAIDNIEAQQKAQRKMAETGDKGRKTRHSGLSNIREFPLASASGQVLPDTWFVGLALSLREQPLEKGPESSSDSRTYSCSDGAEHRAQYSTSCHSHRAGD